MNKKRLKDYPSYEIYDDGRIYSYKSHKFLKAVKNNSGYGTVNLYNGTIEGRRSCSIHQLVAENFVKNPKHYAARKLNCVNSMVSACCRGERHKHHGMRFEYV